MKEEALKLADEYGSLYEQYFMEYKARPAQYTPQTKPLSDEKIPSLLSAQVWRELPIEIKTHLVRAIEERHGIK